MKGPPTMRGIQAAIDHWHARGMHTPGKVDAESYAQAMFEDLADPRISDEKLILVAQAYQRTGERFMPTVGHFQALCLQEVVEVSRPQPTWDDGDYVTDGDQMERAWGEGMDMYCRGTTDEQKDQTVRLLRRLFTATKGRQ